MSETRNGPPAGVLLVNVGSPDAPSTPAVRRYLRQFLADPRVVEAPRLAWFIVRNLVVLPLRPRRSARLYRSIWTPQGSPLLVITRAQRDALASELKRRTGLEVPVEMGMRYGSPAVEDALAALRGRGSRKLLILPLYPQYSATTTASAFDAVAGELRTWRHVPEVRMISGYAEHPSYLEALARSVREVWQRDGEPSRLLMSFHGLPTRYAEAGDPYPQQCRATAAALASALELERERWELAFQSRLGPSEWLQPSTAETLRQWAAAGLPLVDVLCPGFAADCLETLEEIAIAGRALFERTGGGKLRYLPALNDRPDHIAALTDIVKTNLQGWL